ncbi:extensin family protein [Alkalisalibacterium limincola]|uniref:Extensin family protein n=1 Tax=Alkalisalibacterium limincola TaxID=2699169 RepID=A0A5C8KNE8_9GAMM|nr:extensin family protein [Alkalisalibacterium limincola]TXK60984.1 extensin family protein [Alkalisalibacterium limincola]
MSSSTSILRPWLLFVLLALLVWYLLRAGVLVVPDRHNPWAPLQIDDTPNWLTGFKLDRATRDPDLCMDTLAQSPMRYVDLPDRETGPGCGFTNAVRIERTSVAVGEPFSLSCRTALSLAMWEAHELQAAAEEHLGARVRAIEHFGSYACRNVYGRETGRRSQHATADALDIAGFVLDDGRRVRVVRDWQRVPRLRAAPDTGPADEAPSPEALFLDDVHRGACRYFDAVLGPEYNQAHADHFHFDRGGFRACR